MSTTDTRSAPAAPQELPDLDSFQLSKLTDKKVSNSDLWMKYLGFPGGILVFLVLLLWPSPEGLIWSGQLSMAVFGLALVWWVTEPIPNYVTSLVLMILLVTMGIQSEKAVFGALGLSVIWLNIAAFVLSSVLIKTTLAKRLALHLIVRFGHSSGTILMAFMVLQLILAPPIPATAARTVMTLPVMMIVAAIYGASMEKTNNFSRNLILQNMLGINMFSSGFLTGSTCNLIAAAFILEMASHRVYFSEWMLGALPVIALTLLLAWWLGPKWVFPLTEAETKPQIAGGIDKLRDELAKMGPMTHQEKQGALIFGIVLFLWVTDKFHLAWFGFEISAVMAAIIGTVWAFTPKIGLLKWNEADIPWHLLIFSTGAYAGGLALTGTGAARWGVQLIFSTFGIEKGIDFWIVYTLVIAVTAYTHLFFTSKTMRTLILIPIIIAIAQELGFDPVSLALPAAFTLSWVVGLPSSAKPNVILYSTGQYSVMDNFKYGVLVCTIGTILMVIAGMTWFRYLGIVRL